MKHAGLSALDRLKSLIVSLRARHALKEKAPGVFYFRGRAFLHFHEHGEDELYADLRTRGDAFTRLAVNKATERKSLLALVDKALSDGTRPKRR